MLRAAFTYLIDEGAVLLVVLATLYRVTTIGPQELAWIVRAFGGIADGIEFVVSHDAQDLTVSHHGPDDFQNPALPLASVYQIAKEHCLTALRSLVAAAYRHISKMA